MKEEIKNLQAYLNAKHQKEEFSSEKYEFNAMKELDKAAAEMVNNISKAERRAKGLVQEVLGTQGFFEKASKDFAAVETAFRKIEAAAKEMGIAVPRDAISTYKEARAEKNVADMGVNALRRVASEIQKVAI